jgi:ABC-type antimicrobial peptide transport system permease subunit
MGNISVRGISPAAMQLRQQVKLISGKMFQPGTHEIIVGSSIAKRFQDCEVGKQLRFGGDVWTIVGIFTGEGSSFDSEIWGDVEQFMPAFGRPVFSSMTVRLRSANDFQSLKDRVAGDPRTQYVELKHEKKYYQEQSQLMSDFIKGLGLIVTIIFSVGAIIGAMITMYAAVANRTVEIGTLRALGFRRRNVLGAFLIESILVSVFGGCAGIALASLMSFVNI